MKKLLAVLLITTALQASEFISNNDIDVEKLSSAARELILTSNRFDREVLEINENVDIEAYDAAVAVHKPHFSVSIYHDLASVSSLLKIRQQANRKELYRNMELVSLGHRINPIYDPIACGMSYRTPPSQLQLVAIMAFMAFGKKEELTSQLGIYDICWFEAYKNAVLNSYNKAS